MTLQAICDRYGVPAHKNKYVKFQGEACYITMSAGHHLRLRSMETGKAIAPVHPLWEMDYLDGVDYGAAYDKKVEAFNATITSSRERGDA